MLRSSLPGLVLFACALAAFADDAPGTDTAAVAVSVGRSGDPALLIDSSDVIVDQSLEGGYDVWVRGRPGLGSILLTESSADPAMRADSYALRDPTRRAVTAGERRILDGKLLDEAKGPYSIVDSTPEPDGRLGTAFHVFVPYRVVYGYPWSRSGELQILDGTFVNIRAFRKQQADYTGPYRDNPFLLRVTQRVSYLPAVAIPSPKPEPTPEPVPAEEPPAAAPTPTAPAAPAPIPASYMPDAVRAFAEIAEGGKGKAVLAAPGGELDRNIGAFIDEASGDSIDVVLALDTTNSMRDDIGSIRKTVVPILREHTARFASYRIGLLLYRDYNDDYLVKPTPWVTDMAEVQRRIDAVQVGGGRDIPEAVYEALYASIHSYEWSAPARLVILIGDAPPHPLPRGKITREMVYRDAEADGIRIDTIILPAS